MVAQNSSATSVLGEESTGCLLRSCWESARGKEGGDRSPPRPGPSQGGWWDSASFSPPRTPESTGPWWRWSPPDWSPGSDRERTARSWVRPPHTSVASARSCELGRWGVKEESIPRDCFWRRQAEGQAATSHQGRWVPAASPGPAGGPF